MKLDILRPGGSLNSDTDINMLEGGDYPIAINVVKATGVAGGGFTLRQYESIKELPITNVTGTFIKAIRTQGGSIIELYRTDATNATVYRLPNIASTARVALFSYQHSVTDTSFIPDLEMIDNYLVWNYCGSGRLLYWDISRVASGTQSIASLLMAKPAPINLYAITKTKSAGSGVGVLESNDYQFASRFRFDTGEYSVLGPYSEMFKGEKDTSSYVITLTINSTNKPVFAKTIEFYARKGESGSWRRIATQNIDVTLPATITVTWKGDTFETLATKYSAISFSAIPAQASCLSIANNRLFVGNFQDDYVNDAVGSLVITPTTGYTLPTAGGNIKNYFGADTTDAGINSSETGTYYKPFANNSVYSVGLAFFDDAMKTIGVMYSTNFSTGNFTYPICPSFNISQVGGNGRPSFAKYMQLCMSKNLTKSYIFEGYANAMYFELTNENIDTATGSITETSKLSLSLRGGDVAKVKNLIVDISGMFNSNNVYVFSEGDRITINCPGETVGTYRILDLKIKSSDGDKLYCDWIGGLCENDAIPDTSKLYFEIYTPKQQSEDKNLLFYGIGDVIDVSTSIPSTITNYRLGDMAFKKISIPTYSETVLNKGKAASVPAVITKGIVTSVKNTKVSTSVNTLASVTLLEEFSSSTKFTIPFTDINTPNVDGMTISGDEITLGSFYDANVKLDINTVFAFEYTEGSGLDSVNFSVFFTVLRAVYEPYKNTYGPYEKIGIGDVFGYTYDPSYGANTPIETNFVSVDLSTMSQKLSALDKIKVVYEIVLTSSGNSGGASLTVKQKNGNTAPVIVSIVGDQIATETAYFVKPKVAINPTRTNFVVRSVSNTPIGSNEWSFSGGKPYLRFVSNFTQVRTNAIRYGGNLVPGTEVSDLSLFFALDTVEVPVGNGPIMSLQRASRLQGDGDMLLAICTNETSYLLLGEYQLQNSDNSGIQTLATGIVGTIRNLSIRTGIQERASMINFNGDLYWWDEFNGTVVEYTKRGVRVISDIKNKSRFLARKGSGYARFSVDPLYNMIFVKVGTSNAVGFDLSEDKWVSEYIFPVFNQAISFGDRCLYFQNNKIFRTLESGSGNKFGEYFGVTASEASISLVANTTVPISPKLLRIDHNMNVLDFTKSNYIKDNLLRIEITNENGQACNLFSVNFNVENNKLYSQILRDSNSVGGVVSGVYIQGYSNIFKLVLLDKTQDMRIFGLEIEADKVSGH